MLPEILPTLWIHPKLVTVLKVRAKKQLGQHFLNDLSIAQRIADALCPTNYDTLLEIGPGMGALTQFLLPQKTQLYLAEIDPESVLYLKEHYPSLANNIIEKDFLTLPLDQLFDGSLAIVGNFPYNISTQIMFKILEHKEQIPEMVGMFQKEVAERICATHGNKVYGILSVLIQAYYQTEYLFTVDPHVFTPPPKVKSGVMRIVSRKNTSYPFHYQDLRRIVKAAFGQRRKTLRNALKALGVPEKLKGHKFLTLRAEQLSVEDFVYLTTIYTQE